MMGLNYIGSLICHQAAERTIRLGDTLLPLCARCTGIYLGFLIGILYQFAFWRTRLKELPSLKILLASALLLVFLIIHSAGSFLNLWISSNLMKLTLGLLGGSSIALLLFPVFNFSLFKSSKKDTGIRKIAEYSGLLVLLSAGLLMILSGSSIFYSFIAIASIAGIILLYLMLNITIAAQIAEKIISKKKNWQSTSFIIVFTLILTVFEFYLFREKPLNF
jgi:uncharacterized membrane protein